MGRGAMIDVPKQFRYEYKNGEMCDVEQSYALVRMTDDWGDV